MRFSSSRVSSVCRSGAGNCVGRKGPITCINQKGVSLVRWVAELPRRQTHPAVHHETAFSRCEAKANSDEGQQRPVQLGFGTVSTRQPVREVLPKRVLFRPRLAVLFARTRLGQTEGDPFTEFPRQELLGSSGLDQFPEDSRKRPSVGGGWRGRWVVQEGNPNASVGVGKEQGVTREVDPVATVQIGNDDEGGDWRKRLGIVPGLVCRVRGCRVGRIVSLGGQSPATGKRRRDVRAEIKLCSSQLGVAPLSASTRLTILSGFDSSEEKMNGFRRVCV